jgi:hypothetical protein
MPEALIEPPASRGGEALADWAEAIMLLEERDEFSMAEMTRRLGHERGESGDVEVGLLLNEVEVRARRAPNSYPFQPTEFGVARRDDIDVLLYEFLLWLSFPQSPVRREREYRGIDKYFDRIVLKAVKAHFGQRCEGVRFGTPASDERPTGFPAAITWLAGLTRLAEGSEPRNPAKNDAGVDVFVWVPFADGRSDFLVAIVQCTVREDWESKANEIAGTAGRWRGWLDFGRDPLTALAVPFAVPRNHAGVGELRRAINIIFDRTRLLELTTDVYAEDRPRLEAWAAGVRARMLAPPPEPVGLQRKNVA